MSIKQPALFSASDIERQVNLNKQKFQSFLEKLLEIEDISALRAKIFTLKSILEGYTEDNIGIFEVSENKQVSFYLKYLLEDLTQITSALTLERAKYYIQRLIKSITEVKVSDVNDINLNRWKEYDEIITDSLWIFDRRDSSGAHLAWYWGNFIPQIPRQMMLRYTKKGEWVLDPFVGSGTTLIECRRLGRNGVGIELNPEVAEKAKELISKEPNKFNVITDIYLGDSTEIDYTKLLSRYNIEKVQLLIMHPPYYDIIKFSDDPRDLSNSQSVEEFLDRFQRVVERSYDILEKGRYFALVIGDKYEKGEWIPLGFYAMNRVLSVGYKLKSIVVKNFEDTRGKRNQKELWRYRALAGGFYVFKHEYIFVFQKVK